MRLAIGLVIVALSSGCGESGGIETARGTDSPTLESPSPAPPPSYSFVLSSTCGERGFLGDYEVTVRDGKVMEVVNLDRDHPYQPRLSEVPTLADLTQMAESAEEGAIVEFEVDDAGLPQSLSIDHIPEAIDDEECYRVSHLYEL